MNRENTNSNASKKKSIFCFCCKSLIIDMADPRVQQILTGLSRHMISVKSRVIKYCFTFIAHNPMHRSKSGDC